MNWPRILIVLALAYLAVFLEAACRWPRSWLGAQPDLLPALAMVFTALTEGIWGVGLLAMCGGLWFDSLSVNPLGVSVLPLFLIGLGIHWLKELLWRRSRFAQATLGGIAGALQPLGTLFLLLNAGRTPWLGWRTLWQLFVLTASGAALTPALFAVFDWIHRMFDYQPRHPSSFRPDREIKRGRA